MIDTVLALRDFQYCQTRKVSKLQKTTLPVVCPLGKEKPVSYTKPFRGLDEETKVFTIKTKRASPPITKKSKALYRL